MKELLSRAKAAGVKEVVAVIADRGADASIALHQRFGFTEIGRMGRVGFKFGRWLGTVLMERASNNCQRLPRPGAARGSHLGSQP